MILVVFYFSSSYLFYWEILSHFIISVELLYNQRKNNIMKAKHTTQDKRISWRRIKKTCIRTEFQCFHYVAECVVCPVICIHRKGERINKEVCLCMYRLTMLCIDLWQQAILIFTKHSFRYVYRIMFFSMCDNHFCLHSWNSSKKISVLTIGIDTLYISSSSSINRVSKPKWICFKTQ